MSISKIVRAAVFGLGIFAASTAGSVGASAAGSVSIANNSGGVVAQYALKAAKLKNAGTLVKFSGRCDSSCTLFLGLPKRQTCISPGAYFRFHAPSAGNARAVKVAQSYMMRKYPGWVKAWIQSNGGLNGRLITMDYSYASRFIPSCKGTA